MSCPTVDSYNGAAYSHERIIAKYCTLLGTNIAAVIAYEDRVTLNDLRGRSDVVADQVACIGLSGGGLRAAVLRATSDHLRACVIVGMMSTYDEPIDHCVAPHTWMLFPAGWCVSGDWPDVASCLAPTALLVQYALFTAAGVRAADQRIAAHYKAAGAPEAYRGDSTPDPTVSTRRYSRMHSYG
jgi:hypothetical protein